MAVVGEALLSAAFGSLFDKLRCSDLIKLARQEDVHTDLKKWEKQLQSIRREINDAEKKQITQEAVKSWLFDMTVLGYDMEDILDEFAYELTRRKLMGAEAEEAITTKVRKFIPSCCTSFNPTHVVRNVETGSKIRDITSTLQDISARKAGHGLEKVTAAAATSAWQRSPPTTPIAYEPGGYGTEEDKKVILDFLGKVEPYENDVGFISIIGMGGVGKNARAVCFGEICFCLEDNLESNRQSTISKETHHSSFILGKFDVFKKFEAFQEFEHLRTFVALPIHGTFTESFVTSLV